MMGYGQTYAHGYGYGDMMGGYGFGGHAMLFFGVIFIAIIVLLVVWAVRAAHGHGHGMHAMGTQSSLGAGHDEAIAIAKRRLASGEITPEQYGEIMRVLG